LQTVFDCLTAMGILSDTFARLWPRTKRMPSISSEQTNRNDLMSDSTRLCYSCAKCREQSSEELGVLRVNYYDWCAGCVILKEARHRLRGPNSGNLEVFPRFSNGGLFQPLSSLPRMLRLEVEDNPRVMLILAREGRLDVYCDRTSHSGFHKATMLYCPGLSSAAWLNQARGQNLHFQGRQKGH
jgi:hypothetical protein